MEIVVLRHGKANIDSSKKMSSREFGAWVENYNKAGIDKTFRPDDSLINKVKQCNFVVCSHLPRSIGSAKLLGISEPDIINPEFRECEIPFTNWSQPKLPITAWYYIFRFLQLVGYSSNSESCRQAINRSKTCARQLDDFAKQHKSVLFIGHGALNWLLHKQLLKLGWSSKMKSARYHWSMTEYYH